MPSLPALPVEPLSCDAVERLHETSTEIAKAIPWFVHITDDEPAVNGMLVVVDSTVFCAGFDPTQRRWKELAAFPYAEDIDRFDTAFDALRAWLCAQYPPMFVVPVASSKGR